LSQLQGSVSPSSLNELIFAILCHLSARKKRNERKFDLLATILDPFFLKSMHGFAKI